MAPAVTTIGPSARQIEVLALIAEGLKGPEIAERLGLSLHTVRTHKQFLFERLGVAKSAHAVAEGYRRGLLRVDAEDVLAA